MTSSLACRKCGSPMQSTGRGRPPTYCSNGCRRSVEFEIRRINGRLTALEDELERALMDASGLRDLSGRNAEERAAVLKEAIARNEARLCNLLAAGDDQKAGT